MMEQPSICQPQDQMNTAQMPPQMVQQQMMLCPVRFVYETPVLMPQGDQVQQNQTVFINPQNPPPWVRPVQNQVIYLQQVQPSVMQMQHHIDPSHMYLQQHIVNYQQMMPNTVISQNIQEPIRQVPVQVTNMIPPNIMQNIQAVNPNVQHVDSNGQLVHNYELNQTNSGANIANAITNPVNVVQNRQVISNVQNIPQVVNQSIGTQTHKPAELQKQVIYGNVGPQISQQPIARPPVHQIVMNPVQNMPNIQKIQHPQTFAPNIRQTLVQQPQNLVQALPPQNLPQTFVNQLPNPQLNVERLVAPNEIRPTNNPTTVAYNAVRNGQAYTYRAIQPRPVQYKNVPNLLPMPVVQNPLPPRPIASITNTNPTQVNNTQVKSHNIPSALSFNYTRNTNNSPNASRKRKSESPDEIQKKMATRTTVYGDMTVTTKLQNNNPKTLGASNEIGINTGPIHRTVDKNLPTFQIRPMEITVNKVKEEIATAPSPLNEGSSQMNIPPKTAIKQELKDTNQIEKEKLLRNTVFTQARGRLLNDKQSFPTNTKTKVEIKKEMNPIFPINNLGKNNTTQIERKEDNLAPKTNDIVYSNTAVQMEQTSINLPTRKLHIEAPNIEALKCNMPLRLNETVTQISSPKITEPISKPEEISLQKRETMIEKTNETLVENKTDISDTNISNMEPKVYPTKSTKTETTIKSDEIVNTKPIEGTLNVISDDKMEVDKIPVSTKQEPKQENIEIKKPFVKLEREMKKQETIKKDEANITEIDDKKKIDYDNSLTETTNRKEYTNLSANDINGKEIHIVDGNIVKEDKDFVLTHVLDGYVIQESNIPFAIRKPLKEKTLYPNTPLLHDRQNQEQKGPDDHMNMKDSISKDNKKILDLSYLHLNGEKAKEIVEEEVLNKEDVEDNPFGDVKPATVKLWTVEELASHLSKYLWTETISLLREHEIDGESLFLASKPQLLTIGINESHVDAICDFVKS